MSIDKKKLVTLSWLAHLVIALTLCNLVPSIIGRILLLASIGVIGGIQNICIKDMHPPKNV